MFDRLFKLWKGFWAEWISRVETRNPRLLLAAESNALSEAIANYNLNLSKQAGLVNQLKMHAAHTRTELDQETARARALYTANQMEEAGRHAMRVKTLQQQLADLDDQTKKADELYVALTKQRDSYVGDAKARIESIKQKMTRAEVAESQAKLAEIAGITGFSIAGSGATLQRLDEKLDERVAQAQGKVRVAADSVNGLGQDEQAIEERAMQAQALSEFAASMGLEPPPAARVAPVAAAPTRQLGPPAIEREVAP